MKYVCVMFPYPSGDLHVGHWYNYAIADSYCRYLRYIGEDVFQPFGWDAFGLPAENAARKLGRTPAEVTGECIIRMRSQIKNMNTQYEELLCTTEPAYQDKIQQIFNLLKQHGLAYKANGTQQYCSSCETVLAREQVVDDKCERCGTAIQQKELEQWYFAITRYKDRLIDNILNGKSGLPEKTANAQLKWLENLHDWCVSRQRTWGCPIPVDGETDTLDTFVDSSFYFIEYCLRKGIKPQPIDIYIGGSEHACMHLIYARFITMFLYDIGAIDFEEPFKRVVHQGMILKDGQKMSKSKGNVVNLDSYGSDEIRFYLMFIGHYFDGGSWSDKNIAGIRRYLSRMREWFLKTGNETIDISEFKSQIFAYTEFFKFNKVVSTFMILMNQNKHKSLTKQCKDEIIELLEIYMPNIKNTLSYEQ